MSRVFSHRFTPRTTLGVGISAPAVYRFNDQPQDYDDFCQMYARWLAGPTPLSPALSAEERRREETLNWRVFGSAMPTLARLDELGWYPNAHPGPLGLWALRRFDMTGLPQAITDDGVLLNDVLRAARDAITRTTAEAKRAGLRHVTKVMRDLADVKLPAGLDPRTWPKLLDAFRPEAWGERVLSELWARNVITDNGATAMLKNTFNNAGSAVGIMDHLVIAYGNQAYATQTGSTINNASGAQTSIACAGGVQAAAFPANPATITWSYGTTSAETWTLRTATPGAQGATSILVVSQTTTSGNNHVAGDYIVNQPSTSDNPSSVSNSADSGALSSGAFTFSGSGAGNRQVQIQYTFPTSSPAGAYTESYMSNAGTIATGTTATHLIAPPQTINNVTSLQATITEKC